MTESREGKVGIPAWVVYLVFALVWPLWVELFVFVQALTDLRRAGGVAGASSIAVGLAIVAAALASYWLGTSLGRWAPPHLWIVTMVWLAIATGTGLFGFGLSGNRAIVGLLGVLGPFLFGAIGFTVGQRRVAPPQA